MHSYLEYIHYILNITSNFAHLAVKILFLKAYIHPEGYFLQQIPVYIFDKLITISTIAKTILIKATNPHFSKP